MERPEPPPDRPPCRVCGYGPGEYEEAGPVAHLVNAHGVLTADDEVRAILDHYPETTGPAGRAAILATLGRCDEYRATPHYHEQLMTRALIAQVRTGIAAAFGVDERTSASSVPHADLAVIIDQHGGHRCDPRVYICRSATGWVAWAGPGAGRPRDGLLFPVPTDAKNACAMTAWQLDRHGWMVAGDWQQLRFGAVTAPIRRLPAATTPNTLKEEARNGH